MALDPWYKIVTPRREVREGRSFNPDEFAIALEQVIAGQTFQASTNANKIARSLVGPSAPWCVAVTDCANCRDQHGGPSVATRC